MIARALRASAGVVVLAILALGTMAPPARATHVVFGQPGARAELGQPVVFETTLDAAEQPQTVEVLVRLPTDRADTVLAADVTADGSGYRATAAMAGQLAPNTRLQYRFRVRDGRDFELGPAAEVLVRDARFDWQTLEGRLVRLHWYEGEIAFAERALEIGERAITRASELLGVPEGEPVDFFIYADEVAFREALAPGRENVGGQAHSDIRTLFGLIEPFEIGSDWVDTLVGHELTHLVFDSATSNDYHSPPLWLNEGVAVYLSEGYDRSWQATVDGAAASDSLIPLDGLTGLFPTSGDRFRLAYGESVSAVDFFIRTHGEQRLWDLVRSYAEGVSDDEAFRRATGASVADFNRAWMESLGVAVPQPVGPAPGAPGPVPPDWEGGGPGPVPGATVPGATGRPDAPAPSPRATSGRIPGAPGTPSNTPSTAALGLVLALVVVVGIVVAGLYVQRRGRPLG